MKYLKILDKIKYKIQYNNTKTNLLSERTLIARGRDERKVRVLKDEQFRISYRIC